MSSQDVRMLHFDVAMDLYELDGEPITKVLEWAREIVEKVPEEHRASCLIEWEAGGGYGGDPGSLSASYKRPETDLEHQKRERDMAEAAARAQTVVYEHERALYERLKQKFEGVK